MNSYLNKRKYIFLILILGKIILLPFIYLGLNYFDNRTGTLFLLGDFIRYENSQNISNFFKLGEWLSNIGYMIVIYIVKIITNVEATRLFIYSLLSLLTITYSQSILIQIIFYEKRESSLKFKLISLMFSIFNFYILIYSFKPSTDVFGCLGIAILIEALIKAEKKDINKKYFSYWIFFFLILCLLKNSLILILPFLVFTKIFSLTKKQFHALDSKIKFIAILIFSFLVILNIYQFLGILSIYNIGHNEWGLPSLMNIIGSDFSLKNLKDIFNFIFLKLIYLLSVRESVGMTGDWFINSSNGIIISSNIFITNILSAIILFSINIFGLISIFKIFSKNFVRSFIFSLITLLPLISYVTHHRYFLPYSLITTACLPFLFEGKKLKN